MGQAIIKRKHKLKHKLKHNASTLYLNHKIKKFNKKYNQNIKYYETMQKKETKKYPFRPYVVRITHIGGGQKIVPRKYIRYSYIYKGIPGGWYYDPRG
tara:strand:- start:91 stop:384 length:294 start_codon:yes stop_codon:yes gene_type:complete